MPNPKNPMQKQNPKKPRKPTFCKLCNIGFLERSLYVKHVKEEATHSIRVCECDGCYPIYNTVSAKKAEPRVFVASRRPPETIICEPCSKTVVLCTLGVQKHKRMAFHVQRAVESGFWCDSAADTFFTTQERDTHFADPELHNCETPIVCLSCDSEFRDQCQLSNHGLDDKFHSKPRSEISCIPCRKHFSTPKGLEKHMRSKLHRPFKCIGSSLCWRRFKTLAGMMSHLESGACVSCWDREKITAAICQHDTEHVVLEAGVLVPEENRTILGPPVVPLTVLAVRQSEPPPPPPPSQLSSGPDVDLEEGGAPILTPGESILMTPASSRRESVDTSPGVATPLSGAGYSELECEVDGEVIQFKCSRCPKRFRSWVGYQSHLNSVAHAPKIFHCPSFLFPPGATVAGEKETQQRLFKSLSGVVAHMESGACKGGREALDQSIAFLENKLKEKGLGPLKLSG